MLFLFMTDTLVSRLSCDCYLSCLADLRDTSRNWWKYVLPGVRKSSYARTRNRWCREVCSRITRTQY